MRYRDLNQVWEVVTQAGFFVAPIIYPIDVLPERLHVYLYLWPPTPIILFARSVLIDGKVPSAFAHGLLTLEAVSILCHRRVHLLAPGRRACRSICDGAGHRASRGCRSLHDSVGAARHGP